MACVQRVHLTWEMTRAQQINHLTVWLYADTCVCLLGRVWWSVAIALQQQGNKMFARVPSLFGACFVTTI